MDTAFQKSMPSAVLTAGVLYSWNKRRNYKEDTGITINAMMESAVKDPYVDLNPPSKF